ncbi:MAG: hypothetical protein CYPHOPRED_003311 [Cyphobasidiales sp. Tagirdzhanova-0007]|nr:MAG: hypothetical protein CYPHOPRED_003311 [Cyphobasidiales sp. Tagirdzhanova-0007]
MSSIPTVPDGLVSPPLPAALAASTAIGQAKSSSQVGSTLSPEALSALEVYKQRDITKGISTSAPPTGSAPVLKQKFRKITASEKFQTVIQFLRKELNWKKQDSLFLYINAAFSPSPDDTVGNLYKVCALGQKAC